MHACKTTGILAAKWLLMFEPTAAEGLTYLVVVVQSPTSHYVGNMYHMTCAHGPAKCPAKLSFDML